MLTAGLIVAVLAALLHGYIFVMESVTWTSSRTRAVFGMTEDEAQATKLLAFNQGFYNLFLAIIGGVGIVAVGLGHPGLGIGQRNRNRRPPAAGGRPPSHSRPPRRSAR